MTLPQLQRQQDRVRRAESRVKDERETLIAGVREARKTHSVPEIAAALGVVRQRVYQLLQTEPSD